MKLTMLFLVGYALSGGVADAATYYVSKAGSDSNSCAQAQSTSTPKSTINAGMGCLSAGDTLSVRGGSYDEGISSAPSGTSWSTKVRVEAYPGEAVWLRPSVGTVDYAIYFHNDEHYVEFDGINVDGSNTRQNTVVFGLDAATQPHHVRIKNAEIIASSDNSATSSMGANGIEIHGAYPTATGGFEFINLTIHGGGQPGGRSWQYNGYGIYIAAPNNLVENCDIYDNKGAGIHVYNDDGVLPDNNIIRNNRIHNQTRATVAGQSWGILLSGSNNQVYNNTIEGVSASSGGGGGDGIAVYSGTGNKLWNNTIYRNAGPGIAVSSGARSTVVQNNISYANGSTDRDDGVNTTKDHNLEGTDPLFVNAGASDFRILANSPARNTGTGIGQVATDTIGTARPQEGIADIGAYEFTTSSASDNQAPAAPTALRILTNR